jgi:hypothetical protein
VFRGGPPDDDRFHRDHVGVSGETPTLVTVTQQPGDATAVPGSATPAEQLRRVNLIEREAVSDARA